jgi:hypothetical protein
VLELIIADYPGPKKRDFILKLGTLLVGIGTIVMKIIEVTTRRFNFII